MESSGLNGEPFKATKLWNMIIQEFRAGMPLKRHRRGLRGRHHDNCFTSAEAIDWLHNYLQTCDRFGPWVTRAQTVSLLEKFLHSKVIQGVKDSTKQSPGKFEDNGDLYRFVHVSPIKKLRSALSSRSNLRSGRTPLKTINSEPVGRALSYDNPAFSIQDADREGRQESHQQVSGKSQVVLTPAQREEVWKNATLNRLQRLLWLNSLDDLLDTSLINPRHIIHNCTHVSRNGVVLVPKDQDDLPHWVLSAMKCLANWPNSPDSDLPNYPGFERDVFKTVSNYFLSLPQPLMTHHLYQLITESFGLYLSDDKSYTEEALRLCCLLLPPVNRRKVHLLFKLMTKMENNPQLVLSSRRTTRQLVLQIFSRAILCPQEEIDFNETLSARIIEYLMDNHGNVFSQPEELKADVQNRLSYLCRAQIKQKSENQKPVAPSFCQKLTLVEYETQKISNSQQAIIDLLEVIIRDQSMPAKDKKKKLKQFQKTYPDIYARRLPTTASEAELFPEKPKIKQPMTNVRKSFTKLKSLR